METSSESTRSLSVKMKQGKEEEEANGETAQEQHQSSSSAALVVPAAVDTSAAAAAAAAAASIDDAAHEPPSTGQQVDFMGPSHAVKNLFSMPYSGGAVSVAVHNIHGTLLVDADPLQEQKESFVNQQQTQPLFVAPETVSPSSLQLMTLPEQNQQSDAIALINSLLQKATNKQQAEEDNGGDNNSNTEGALVEQFGEHVLKLPPPEQYSGTVLPHEPREYLPWKFQNMNLLVGSDALIYRPPTEQSNNNTPTTSSSSTALTVRVADALQLQRQLEKHQADSSVASLNAASPTKRSYADVTTTPKNNQQQHEPPAATAALGSPDSVMLRLQSCVVPATGSVLGGGGNMVSPLASSQQTTSPETATTTPSPVCTVLDAYLDNIIANVPQLALCLYEKGFIQSVKLMNTQDIPSTMLQPATLDINQSPVISMVNSSSQDEPLFSPQVMEMNASMLLRFLRSNCTRDNATYLLTRQEGQSNIQLYDISSVSALRQKKWMWWLANMSFRFAARLKQFAPKTNSQQQQRAFRARQRSLLKNSLELLEDLKDRDGPAHETFCAAVCEGLADTFLSSGDENTNSSSLPRQPQQQQQPQPSTTRTSLSKQPYHGVSEDALNKALDHLIKGIRTLWPVLERNRQEQKKSQKRQNKKMTSPHRKHHVVVVHRDGSSDSSSSSSSESEESDDEPDNSQPLSMEQEAVTMQLFGLHHKLINVYLRLAEHHLNNYWSSSAMQSLRTAARRIANAVSLLQPLASQNVFDNTETNVQGLQQSLQFQYAWLWEHCGYFARSFAADELWRERGHCSGDDVVSLLRDVEAAFCGLENCKEISWLGADAPISTKTDMQVSLHSLSALVIGATDSKKKRRDGENDKAVMEAAKAVLERQKMLRRDERRVLVAACISYSRAIGATEIVASEDEKMHNSDNVGGRDDKQLLGPAEEGGPRAAKADSTILGVLRQRLGDACNEIGKILLNELRTGLTAQEDKDSTSRNAAVPLLSSAEFWFREGLCQFEECKDLRNLALLRCNLCQCSKLRANNIFLGNAASISKAGHAETCLSDGADHLQKAHETLGERDVDPMTWDMVSDELAATYLVLGVRRRQTLLGAGTTPVMIQAMRLNPGKERSIVDPMTKSLTIYEQSGNAHQAAAVHYQLALFYSKVWTCQRDETKTREKLSAAFTHYGAAHAYFSGAQRGNEATFCILCLDLSNLYSAVSGQECVSKALDRCLDTTDAFSPEAIKAATERRDGIAWFDQMATLATSIEDRVFKLMLSLVKLEKEAGNTSDTKYKDLYRVGLTAKASVNKSSGDDSNDGKEQSLTYLHDLLSTIKDEKARLLTTT